MQCWLYVSYVNAQHDNRSKNEHHAEEYIRFADNDTNSPNSKRPAGDETRLWLKN